MQSKELKPVVDERRGGTSASNAEADLLCPGRHLAQKGLPQPPPSEDADFGRAIHAALAKRNDEGLTVEQQDIYESCVAIEDKLVDQCFGPDKAKCAVFREQRYWVKVKMNADLEHPLLHSGQPDVIYRLGPRALICEYKTLPGQKQESPENQQLRDQVVLAAGHLVLSQVAAAVIQPLVTHEPQLVLYDQVSIKQAEEDLFKRVLASNNPKAERHAGEVQCAFCLAKNGCKEYAQWSSTNTPAPMSILNTPVEHWTPEWRALFCERKSAAKKWLEECEFYLKQLMKRDKDAVPGFELKSSGSVAPVTDPQELFNRFAMLGGDLDQFMTCVEIAKGKLEPLVRTLTKKKGKALNAELAKLLDGVVTETPKEPSIQRRKEANANALREGAKPPASLPPPVAGDGPGDVAG